MAMKYRPKLKTKEDRDKFFGSDPNGIPYKHPCRLEVQTMKNRYFPEKTREYAKMKMILLLEDALANEE